MKKFYLMSVILFTITMNIFAQTYPEVSIRDIQYIDPDSLNIYFTDFVAGPLTGDTVTVTGVVMTPPYKGANPANGTLMYFGSTLAGFFLQDTSETEWSAILVLISTPANYPAFQTLDSGAVVKVTGVVTHYEGSTQKTTELFLIKFDGTEVIDFATRPKPVVLTLDSLKELGTSNSRAISEKWESVYVEIKNVRTLDRGWTNGGFRIIDENGTIASIYTRSNNIYGTIPPADNTILEYIRGYIEIRSEGAGGATINPMYLDDIKVSLFPPSITNITRDHITVPFGQNVTISANIKDPDGTVVNAKLYWRKNSGLNNEVSMSNTSDSTYQAIIPAQNDSCLVDYFITAEDNQANVSRTPADTAKSRFFYLVLDRPLTIQDVEYSPFGGPYSGYNNMEVTVRGIVVADTSDIPLGPQVIIQNGTGPWSGIRVNGTQTLLFNKGDDVTVTGTVVENFSVTNLNNINSASNFTLNSSGNSLPEPQLISTDSISNKASGTVSAEQWENVLVKYVNVNVTDDNADGATGPNVSGSNSNFGEILVADASNVNTRVELQDGNNTYHNWDATGLENIPIRISQGNKFTELRGIMYYSFGNYKLIPRTNADFVGYTTSVEDQKSTPLVYKLAQNYPNPFNPSTRINYSIKEEGLVTLRVFNILGQEVATLVNDIKDPGNYNVNFDANKLSSGIYLYKIDSNGFTQTKKMILIK
jgi:DNA/RNA endonuclease YhcR with UshA esterase domain